MININESAQIEWNLVFALVLLRMISFNLEFKAMKESKHIKVNDEISHCSDCDKKNFCLKFLSNTPTNNSDYNLMNLLIYLFYPPLYFAGPTVLFNSFIYQLNNENSHDRLSSEKVKYILRHIFSFICFEIFNSLIYVNAYLTAKQNQHLWEQFDYHTYASFCFYLLIFIWFKFTIIWKTTRIWAWLDGIKTEENMNRCMYNNYCFEGFWRAWHRSFNVWLIRYIFIPLGGSKYKLFSIWVIFSFVALWHDLKLNLLIWGWFICLFLIPEILMKNFFNEKRVKFN